MRETLKISVYSEIYFSVVMNELSKIDKLVERHGWNRISNNKTTTT
jgi:hypothetical protein